MQFQTVLLESDYAKGIPLKNSLCLTLGGLISILNPEDLLKEKFPAATFHFSELNKPSGDCRVASMRLKCSSQNDGKHLSNATNSDSVFEVLTHTSSRCWYTSEKSNLIWPSSVHLTNWRNWLFVYGLGETPPFNLTVPRQDKIPQLLSPTFYPIEELDSPFEDSFKRAKPFLDEIRDGMTIQELPMCDMPGQSNSCRML
ncbi:unnamed protein product [Lepeophtheirus salmonis]|uniref:(salmon louse) hypothetical protein n=1 Tax=Lepeophtheirus salmonis TaxID=72036 RepID=A0A7R8D1G4_LEPSM|nr:unnamed protein product [Lepeophtheirus salmonis]CAF2995487.1 unnamed protein product [Lepeophtheirus salmonis]